MKTCLGNRKEMMKEKPSSACSVRQKSVEEADGDEEEDEVSRRHISSIQFFKIHLIDSLLYGITLLFLEPHLAPWSSLSFLAITGVELWNEDDVRIHEHILWVLATLNPSSHPYTLVYVEKAVEGFLRHTPLLLIE